MIKGITTPSVERQRQHQRQVSIDLYVTLPLTLGNGGGSILERHHRPNVFNLTLPLTLTLDARCGYSLTLFIVVDPERLRVSRLSLSTRLVAVIESSH